MLTFIYKYHHLPAGHEDIGIKTLSLITHPHNLQVEGKEEFLCSQVEHLLNLAATLIIIPRRQVFEQGYCQLIQT